MSPGHRGVSLACMVKDAVGGWVVTVTVTVAVLEHPLASVPVTV